jgi:hypothetical protein
MLPQLKLREPCWAGREEQIARLAPVLGAIWCAARTIPRREPDGASGSRRDGSTVSPLALALKRRGGVDAGSPGGSAARRAVRSIECRAAGRSSDRAAGRSSNRGSVMPTLPPTYTATRVAVHSVAEHVLCAVRHAAVGRVGLTPLDDGVATPEFSGRVVGLRGAELFDTVEGRERRAPVTTLSAAGEFFGITPGPPPLWTPTTNPEVDALLDVHDDSVLAMAEWFATVAGGLRSFAPDAAQTLWPEHFDLAIELGGATYGGSPGDDQQAEPYAYVGPPADPVPDGDSEFWNASFGASRSHDEIRGADDLASFYREAQERLQRR